MKGDAFGEERWWRENLVGQHPGLRWGRELLKHLPDDPRCKLCAAPFKGIGAPLMRVVGKGPWPKNPKFCRSCFAHMEAHRGGAEVECTLLFADIRNSTALAETMPPSDLRTFMDRFYGAAARVLVEHDAIVDKFVGDEVFAIFVPGMAGPAHAARAMSAARGVLDAMAHPKEGNSIPVGIGIDSGIAFVGTVGEDPHLDLTALGDPVNVAARLATAASAGEILATAVAARYAGLSVNEAERREIVVKGKSEPLTVVTVVPASEH